MTNRDILCSHIKIETELIPNREQIKITYVT